MIEQNQQPQQQEPELTLKVKASWVNIIIAGLDEIPHKYSRPVIDNIGKQIQAQQQQAPQGPLESKVVQ